MDQNMELIYDSGKAESQASTIKELDVYGSKLNETREKKKTEEKSSFSVSQNKTSSQNKTTSQNNTTSQNKTSFIFDFENKIDDIIARLKEFSKNINNKLTNPKSIFNNTPTNEIVNEETKRDLDIDKYITEKIEKLSKDIDLLFKNMENDIEKNIYPYESTNNDKERSLTGIEKVTFQENESYCSLNNNMFYKGIDEFKYNYFKPEDNILEIRVELPGNVKMDLKPKVVGNLSTLTISINKRLDRIPKYFHDNIKCTRVFGKFDINIEYEDEYYSIDPKGLNKGYPKFINGICIIQYTLISKEEIKFPEIKEL